MKKCIKCGIEKELDFFANTKYKRKDGSIKLGKENACKKCRAKRYHQLYYQDGTWSAEKRIEEWEQYKKIIK